MQLVSHECTRDAYPTIHFSVSDPDHALARWQHLLFVYI
jgi:hypothetical protein